MEYFFSQRVLLELTNTGYTREAAYKIVQKNAMSAWKDNSFIFKQNYLRQKNNCKNTC